MPDFDAINASVVMPDSSVVAAGANEIFYSVMDGIIVKTSPAGKLENCTSQPYQLKITSPAITSRPFTLGTVLYLSDSTRETIMEAVPGSGFSFRLLCSKTCVLSKIAGPAAVCLGSDPVYQVSIKGICQGTVQFSSSTGGALQATSDTSVAISFTSPGRFVLYASLQAECRVLRDSLTIHVFDNPVVRLDHTSSLCTGETRLLDAGDYSSYEWSDGSRARTLPVNGVGLYSVEVTDGKVCKGKDTTAITTLLPLPEGFLPPDTAICSYGSLLLRPPGNYSGYFWSTGATTAALTISQPGTYWLEVEDANRCTGRDSVLVSLKECLKGFYMPTAFTPNDDGKNDRFKPLLFGNVKTYQFTIYNRWGEVVFQTADPKKGWDGTHTSRNQGPSVFVWVCAYQLEGEKEKMEKGTVVLIR